MARHFAALDAFPQTEAWFRRLEERPAFQAALPGPQDELLYQRDFYPAWSDR